MRDEWIRTLRTVVQVIAGLAVVTPLLLGAVGVSTTIGVGAAVVTVAATITRIMQIPEIDDWVNGKLRKKSE